jgi:folate-binding protein YgfZ
MFSPEQYRALTEGAGLLDRSYRGRLRLGGQDRRDYLQGLLTNDIAALTAGTGCYAALLTAQGRMISDMYVVETGDSVIIDVEPEVVDRVRGLLEQFVFSEDVQVADETSALAQVGVFGPSSPAVIVGALTCGGGERVRGGEIESLEILQNRTVSWRETPLVIVRRDDIGVAGFDLLIDRSQIENIVDALRSAGAEAVDRTATDVTRIEAGRPLFHRDMDETTIPLEAGIEERAISLTKGCYVGQEIIIRVLHRGHGRVARRLVGITLESAAAVPAAGDRLRVGDREVGSITSAAWSPALQRPIALGYVHREFTEAGTAVEVVSASGALPGMVSRLPFVSRQAASTARSARHQPVETPER